MLFFSWLSVRAFKERGRSLLSPPAIASALAPSGRVRAAAGEVSLPGGEVIDEMYDAYGRNNSPLSSDIPER